MAEGGGGDDDREKFQDPNNGDSCNAVIFKTLIGLMGDRLQEFLEAANEPGRDQAQAAGPGTGRAGGGENAAAAGAGGVSPPCTDMGEQKGEEPWSPVSGVGAGTEKKPSRGEHPAGGDVDDIDAKGPGKDDSVLPAQADDQVAFQDGGPLAQPAAGLQQAASQTTELDGQPAAGPSLPSDQTVRTTRDDQPADGPAAKQGETQASGPLQAADQAGSQSWLGWLNDLLHKGASELVKILRQMALKILQNSSDRAKLEEALSEFHGFSFAQLKTALKRLFRFECSWSYLYALLAFCVLLIKRRRIATAAADVWELIKLVTELVTDFISRYWRKAFVALGGWVRTDLCDGTPQTVVLEVSSHLACLVLGDL